MTWQSEREEWNREGKCARETCKVDFGRRRHYMSHNGLYYCGRCSRLISEMNGVVAVKETLIDGVWTEAQEKSSVSP